jgi:hypothetical protein
MLLALLLQAAEATEAAAEEAEPSKTPFYVAGLVLAGWAVVLSAIGLSRPDFPRRGGAARGVMLLSTLLVAGALATAVTTS